MIKKITLTLTLVACFGFGMSANATLIGDTVTSDHWSLQEIQLVHHRQL